MAIEKKVRVGVSFDSELAVLIEHSASQLKELGVDRSEVVNAILAEFFETGGTTEAVWEVVSRRRIRRRTS
ncbi:MAG: hypothetical protein JRN24_01585 [Nitrososphaerota archaeon]|nr:hypothetical protein [Nitrososphaerota archaeon]